MTMNLKLGRAREIEYVKGELKKVFSYDLTKYKIQDPEKMELREKIREAESYEELKIIEKEAGYKNGWARHRARAKGFVI